MALPWDMDFVFNNSASSPLIQASGNLRRVIDIPANQRLYYGHVRDLLETTFNVDYLRPWLEHYGRVAGQSFPAQASYMQQRADSARGQLDRTVPERPFEITTQGGQDFRHLPIRTRGNRRATAEDTRSMCGMRARRWSNGLRHRSGKRAAGFTALQAGPMWKPANAIDGLIPLWV